MFRDRLEDLIIAALEEAGRSQSADVTVRLAIAVNAVIDGVWRSLAVKNGNCILLEDNAKPKAMTSSK